MHKYVSQQKERQNIQSSAFKVSATQFALIEIHKLASIKSAHNFPECPPSPRQILTYMSDNDVATTMENVVKKAALCSNNWSTDWSKDKETVTNREINYCISSERGEFIGRKLCAIDKLSFKYFQVRLKN